MKSIEHCFPVLLCSTLYRMAVWLCGGEVLVLDLYKVFLTLESVDEILKCDHSNESY